MSYPAGALVRARGREWVVLPDSEDDLLVLRPLGGTDAEIAGVLPALETVEPARFELPDPSRVGDHRSCRLLRDAVRLGFRSTTGPFRSFARLAVDPRPYQLVPLLMALKQDPVRILIADDVGIGKTIEAGLIARELLDRGEVGRLAVLCPPHLAEQWQGELADKFHIDAELVLPGTAGRLERNLPFGTSVFEAHPFVIVSLDFIKSDRRRDEFVRTCPRLVIVDEAHTCAYGYEGRGGRHLRHQLVRAVAEAPDRHLILVSATPHSGKEESFRSLLAHLDSDFAELPEDLSGPERRSQRKRLAAHFVQRRRGDIRHFMGEDTPFPEREEKKEESYELSEKYKDLFHKVLRFARETVQDPTGGRHRQRVRWWSALALLRSLASSPAAAAATLRNRAPAADSDSAEEADEIGRRTVFDVDAEEQVEGIDVIPGADPGAGPREESASAASGPDSESSGESEEQGEGESAGRRESEHGSKDEEDDPDHRRVRRRLLEMAREAEALEGDADEKLVKAAKLVKELLAGGFRPILFCRYIPTAEYVARELRERLPSGTEVAAVTGVLPPAEREQRVLALAEHPKRILVCTDCLSEGINLQEHFDAVMHYDLSWSPTRHEQREGRVDRYGQKVPTVRVLTYFGTDNQIDGVVLDVLIRKHKKIRHDLGIAVPVPMDTNKVVEAVFEGLLLREEAGTAERYLPGFEEILAPRKEELYREWERAADREKRSRTLFAQETIKAEEVARELDAARAAAGSTTDVADFTLDALRAHGAVVEERPGRHDFDLTECPVALRDVLGLGDTVTFDGRFELPVDEGVRYLHRTHPLVGGLASYVTDSALDANLDGVARRCGAIRTRAVQRRTTLLLARFRYKVATSTTSSGGGRHAAPGDPGGIDSKQLASEQLAEECLVLAFAGAPDAPEWLDPATAETLLTAEPDGNIHSEQAAGFVRRVVDAYEQLEPDLVDVAHRRAAELLEVHRRVRSAARIHGVRHTVEPHLPPDLLGIYVLLPVPSLAEPS